MERKLIISKNIYSLTTLKKAAYRYINIFSINFLEEDEAYTCILTFSEKCTDLKADYYSDDFKKEILDQDLREIIKAETEPTRNLILAHAFSKTGLVENG